MRHFIIVYQYGKVASTSLVATMNALADVEAVQAHFLGPDSLREMVSLIVDPATSDYFHRHQVGQFVENARTTRIINAYRQDRERDSALSIVSLYRDPFEWFRSSILQDIAGYLPALRAIGAGDEAEENAGEAADDEGRVGRALERTLGIFSDIVGDLGGVDAVIGDMRAHGRSLAEHPSLGLHPEHLAMFYMMLRPFSWFETHFRPAIGYAIDDLAKIEEGVLHRNVPWASLFVLRYEALESQVRVVADRLGIGPMEVLASENVSETKPMSRAVRDAFATPPALALRAHFVATTYARRFGYA